MSNGPVYKTHVIWKVISIVLAVIQDACTIVLGTGCADFTYYRRQRKKYILHISTTQFVVFMYGKRLHSTSVVLPVLFRLSGSRSRYNFTN